MQHKYLASALACIALSLPGLALAGADIGVYFGGPGPIYAPPPVYYAPPPPVYYAPPPPVYYQPPQQAYYGPPREYIYGGYGDGDGYRGGHDRDRHWDGDGGGWRQRDGRQDHDGGRRDWRGERD